MIEGPWFRIMLWAGHSLWDSLFSPAQDDQGNEGVAIKKNAEEKIMKVGKKVAANKIRRAQHEELDSMNTAHEDAAADLVVQAQTQARAVPTVSRYCRPNDPICYLNSPFMDSLVWCMHPVVCLLSHCLVPGMVSTSCSSVCSTEFPLWAGAS